MIIHNFPCLQAYADSLITQHSIYAELMQVH